MKNIIQMASDAELSQMYDELILELAQKSNIKLIKEFEMVIIELVKRENKL